MISPITSMKDAFSLKGKNAIVTGGNRGLGLGICKAFAEQGAHVAVFCRDQEKAAEALAELAPFGGEYRAFSCDVSDMQSCIKAVDEACAWFGDVDILVNNAGVGFTGRLLDEDEDLANWYSVLNVDLNGTVNMTYVVGKKMRDAGHGGSIVNVSSNAGLMINYGNYMPAYSTSKAAVNHFTRSMAVELAAYDIRVNAIAPGFTNTELSKWIPEDVFSYITDRTVAGRFGEPLEVGALAVYLASPAAAQITGHVAVIDGGYMIRC